jgi:sterol desaturase/sphingolipid hydroxylase (fatty acid hydroxylase superfamily)
MIFYLLGLLSYYKIRNKPVPASICLLFFGVIAVPPATTLFFLIYNHWIFQLLAFAGGLFCWTFIEYFTHRFLMHGKEKENYQKSYHFVHHSSPGVIFTNNFKRTFYSLVAITLNCLAIFYNHYLLLPAGIITGFALYNFMHLCLHKHWASYWFGKLQYYHMQHHFGQTENCFGVTSMLWDRIFNTITKSEKTGSIKALDVYYGRSSKKLITHKQAV